MHRPHFVTFGRRSAIKSSRYGRLPGAKWSSKPNTEDAAMTDQTRTYVTEKFASQPGERWRRFLERVGTRSNDFGTRLARARFVYLHRREVATHWLPL